MVSSETYSFAFTGASMKFYDFIRLANYVVEHDINIDTEYPDPNEIMRREKSRTNRREFQEMIKRMRLLTPEQREILTEVDSNGQRQLAFLAICKAYPNIKDFVIEIVREKYLSLDFLLTDADYQIFLNRKSELHPEIEEFSDSTLKKGRQVTWRILEQGGIINNTTDRKISPQFVNPRVVNVIINEDPELLKIFLLTDAEIKEIKL